jgi:hypothetical protein
MPIDPDTPPGTAETAPPSTPSVELSLGLVADVQDALMMAMTDLKRLEGLLDHATGNLLERFGSANHALAQVTENGNDSEALRLIRHDLHQAVTELQFHDMATQLIGHTGQVLQGCAWRLADSAMPPEEDELPLELDLIPERPSPVTQSEMEAGSIELF